MPAESAADRDLQKVLQQLEPHISFLEELTKMGGAMRTVLTKILTNQQTFKELSMGECEMWLSNLSCCYIWKCIHRSAVCCFQSFVFTFKKKKKIIGLYNFSLRSTYNVFCFVFVFIVIYLSDDLLPSF